MQLDTSSAYLPLLKGVFFEDSKGLLFGSKWSLACMLAVKCCALRHTKHSLGQAKHQRQYSRKKSPRWPAPKPKQPEVPQHYGEEDGEIDTVSDGGYMAKTQRYEVREIM